VEPVLAKRSSKCLANSHCTGVTTRLDSLPLRCMGFSMLKPGAEALLLTTLFSAFSKPTDGRFRERDQQLLAEYEKLHSEYQRREVSREDYVRDLQHLRVRELTLFAHVRKHEFSDITEGNYWHRGRLRFPGTIEQELRPDERKRPEGGRPLRSLPRSSPAYR
jgi:hypothetical protein